MTMKNKNQENFIDIQMLFDSKKGYFDISFTDEGDIKSDSSFDTTINCSLLTDGRADSSEVPLVERQRGTIVDLFTRKRNGSKVWLIDQSRADLSAKNKMIDYARNALYFLVEEGFIKDLSVSAELKAEGISLFITFVRFTGVYDKYRFDAWNSSIYKV